MTEILMAILIIAIGVFTAIITEGEAIWLMIFCISAGCFFIYDNLKEIKYGETHYRHQSE